MRASLIGRLGLFLLRRFRRSVWSELFHLWWNHKRKQLMNVSRRRRMIFISRRTNTRLKTRDNKILMLWFILILGTAVQVIHSPVQRLVSSLKQLVSIVIVPVQHLSSCLTSCPGRWGFVCSFMCNSSLSSFCLSVHCCSHLKSDLTLKSQWRNQDVVLLWFL